MPPAAKPGGQASIVQDLQTQLRDVRVENARLRMELQEVRSKVGRPDPRLRLVEQENSRLREELAAARTARDALDAGLRAALDRLEAAGAAARSPRR